MIPIFEHDNCKGIGHTISTFQARFAELCAEHIKTHRAKAFAFIFYESENKDLRTILNDQGVFAKLDRISGTNLSVFYLQSDNRRAIDRFNAEFLSRLDLNRESHLPCVVFFRLNAKKIEDVVIAQLESPNLVHGFHELVTAIEQSIHTRSIGCSA